MTRSQALAWASHQLNFNSSPTLDAEVLLASVLNLSRTKLLADLSKTINLVDGWRFKRLISQRKKGMPVAYLTRHKEFYGRKFLVNKHVLIPRPETELLIEKSLIVMHASLPINPATWNSSRNSSIKTIVDIGTGSGCIAITLTLELPSIKVIATDISAAALKVARYNSQLYKVTNRIAFKQSDLLTPLKNRSIDLLIANLPYVTKKEYDANPELKFEPAGALLEQSGLFETFCQQLAAHQEIKFILLETSPLIINSWLEVIKKFLSSCSISIFPDLSGNSRLIIIDTKKTSGV